MKSFDLKKKLYLLIVSFGVYFLYLIFFSSDSYMVYQNLKKQKIVLIENIFELQKTNAKLQKEFLELKNLEPE